MTKIYELNNEAAICIENKNYERSIELLQEAAKQIRDIMASTPSFSNPSPQQGNVQQTQDYARNGANLCSFIAESKSGFNSSFLKVLSPSGNRVGSSRRGYSSIFASPIVMNYNVSLFEPLAFERVSYVLVYNLALAHHCMVIQYEENNYSSSSSSLSSEQRQQQEAKKHVVEQKALILYEKSHNLLVRAASDNWDVSVLHSLAILCNLGHLHHVMGTEEKSEMCYQKLLSVIFCIVDSRTGNCNNTPLSNENGVSERLLDGFFQNVMPLLQKGAVAAAA